MDRLREQLLDAFRQQMEIRKSLMELDNSNMEIQMDTSKHLLTIAEWVNFSTSLNLSLAVTSDDVGVICGVFFSC